MNTITAILEPAADGMLHLPLPAAWRGRLVRVKAELEPIPPQEPPAGTESLQGFGYLKGRIWMSPDFDKPLEDFKDCM